MRVEDDTTETPCMARFYLSHKPSEMVFLYLFGPQYTSVSFTTRAVAQSQPLSTPQYGVC